MLKGEGPLCRVHCCTEHPAVPIFQTTLVIEALETDGTRSLTQIQTTRTPAQLNLIAIDLRANIEGFVRAQGGELLSMQMIEGVPTDLG